MNIVNHALKNKIINRVLLCILLVFILSGCVSKNEEVKNEITIKKPVTTVKAGDAKKIKESIEFPAVVASDQEAKIIAKTSGNIKGFKIKAGEKVSIGQILGKIDEIGAGKNNSTFNSDQIKQASIAVRQAQTSYQLAQTNYQNLLAGSEKDLRQAEISGSQASAGSENITATSKENLKSAEISYEQAKIATENARLTLDNRKKQTTQTTADTDTNAGITADTVANTCNNVIFSINEITGLDQLLGPSLSYKYLLSVKNTGYLISAQKAYLSAKLSADNYQKSGTNVQNKVDLAIKLVQETKKLADSAKQVFDNTISAESLPQTSVTGPSLSGLQTSVTGYQSQINSALSQINSAKQSLANSKLGGDSSLDALEKAYELSKKQEASAKQNLANIKAGNKSQGDQARFGNLSAKNQLENTKTRINSQISVSLSQIELSRLQYQNAVLALQSLYDIHQIISPIDGMVASKNADEGETVSPGQIIAVISRDDRVRLQFYVDRENLSYLKSGQECSIIDSSGKEYKAKISSLSPTADSQTKRFLIEAVPDKFVPDTFTIGTVMNVSISITKNAKQAGSVILPLSAIEVGQNGNTVFILEENKAKKITVQLISVNGESAEVKGDFSKDTLIITAGNKNIKEGEEVEIK